VPSGAPPEIGDLAFRTYTSTDADGDLIGDPVDNCPGEANADQSNADANFIDLTPPKANDDLTWIYSDNAGDACDADDDNDGLPDATELALPGLACPAATGPTSPVLLDTDGDRFADSAECLPAVNTDPTNVASKPANLVPCALVGDDDGDGLSNRLEVCNYASNPNNANTDGDLCSDGKEVASVNPDTIVNSGDQGLLASEYGPVPPHLLNMDLNRDGTINSGDQGLQASQLGSC
jgi:hypothetical protein